MPSIRAIQVVHSLRALELVSGGEHERALRRMRPESLARIRDARRFDWLPVALDVELSHAVADEFGPVVAAARSRQSLGQSTGTPLLRPFIDGVVKLFGLEPSSMFRQVPLGWNAVYRDAGRMRYEVSSGADRSLIYEDVPVVILESRVYLDAIASALHSLLDLCNADGAIEVATIDRERARVQLRVTWS
ncbi:hypothetical protein DB30_06744 [Enhygromyxa salina]|uniref:DUF2378 family protein n=1 Tax=Enhygromyxa salina TaxID=215803 RepID=A0A0C2D304_9BACT|nr:hypothetical protein [Enhygromyxa salina]KIG14517.1 hypothetical protein DB30_06744 [Enhygromyxa salina]